MDNMDWESNKRERYIVEYDTQTGAPIYSDGTRGRRDESIEDRTKYQSEAQTSHQASPDGFTVDEVSENLARRVDRMSREEEGPQPMPEGNVYRFQNAEAVLPKKKKEKKGWTMPKIAIGAALFGVIASGCFFGVNAGLNALTGGDKDSGQTEQIEPAKIEAHTDNTQVVNTGATDVSEVVENVMPSVVGIIEKGTVQNMFGQEYEAMAAGSGFIVKQDGDELLVVTNGHVVQDAKEINVIFCDNEQVTAKVKGGSSANDIALLTVDMTQMKDTTKKAVKAAVLRSTDDVKVGEMAIAIGNANGSGQSVTVGYVSAKDRTFVVGTTNSKGETNTRPMLQTDAAINPGNSGGPLIDAKGRVIGITTSKEFSASDGRDIVGMNYAIPMSDGVSIINDLMNREVLKDEEKGYLGITGETIDETTGKNYNIPEGVYVKSLSDTGAAYKAGVKQGDVITAIDGTEVKQLTDVQEIVNSKRVGTTIELTVQRNNGSGYEEKKISVKLASKDTLDGLPQDETEEDEQQDPYNQQPQGDDDYQIMPWGFGY